MANRSSLRAPVLLSLCLPGLGQLYNRDWMKAALFLAPTVLLIVHLNSVAAALQTLDVEAIMDGRQTLPLGSVAIDMVLLMGLLIWSGVDALYSARRKQRGS